MGNLGTDTPPLVPIPGEITRGYRYPYSGIDTWCITRGTDTLPSRYRYPNSSVGFGKVNPVHVRNQKHELTPPRSRCQESDSSTVEGTVYKQAEQLFGLRHKPLTLQDALPRSESAEKICPGRTRCLLSRHPLCHPAQADYRSP
ncbi:hypothetical protein GQ457_03G013960 [Hibiscus cannabinus]